MAAPIGGWRGIMGSVAEKCGEDVAHAMMDKMAGVECYVPAKFTENGPLAVIGKEHAEKVIQHFAKVKLYVPSSLSTRPTVEDMFAKIEPLVKKGVSTADIAVQLGISQGYVFQVRRRVGAVKIAKMPDPKQLPLFD